MPSGRRGQIEEGTPILEAARQLGVAIESICGGHMACNKCRVQIEDGAFTKHGITSKNEHASAPSDQETELLNKLKSPDHRLSCVACVEGDMLVFVPEESRGQKQVIRKSARERKIDIHPAIRKVYVEVEKPSLGEHRGDWGRLQAALEKEWNLTDLEIDLRVLRQLQPRLRKGKWGVTVTVWQEKQVIDVQSGYTEGTYGLAVDIGSTTVAGYLCDLRTGEVLATESVMNPQITYGEDLMSRISYSIEHGDGLNKMHKAIIGALNKLATNAANGAGLSPRDIHEAVMVGNTTMVAILLGIHPIELGGAPFALANRDMMDWRAAEMGIRLHPGAFIHLLPAEAGHVGADNVGALIAEEPYKNDEITLMVDVGTNAEIILGNKDWMFSASSPTGPAFEGAQIEHGMRAAPGAIERVRIDPVTRAPRFRVIGEERWSNEWDFSSSTPIEEQPNQMAAGICGSGIIEVVAELFLAGILLSDGRFDPACTGPHVVWDGSKGKYMLATELETTNGKPLFITQNDVRNIQLGKSALYAGAKLLMKKAEIKTVDKVILAGAFGSYIDTKHAMVLGLIPDCQLDKVVAVGNAAGDGARIALLNRKKRDEAQRLVEWVTYVETAIDPDFQDEFVDAIAIPHATDPYPHLADILPKPAVSSNGTSEKKPRIARRPRRKRSDQPVG